MLQKGLQDSALSCLHNGCLQQSSANSAMLGFLLETPQGAVVALVTHDLALFCFACLVRLSQCFNQSSAIHFYNDKRALQIHSRCRSRTIVQRIQTQQTDAQLLGLKMAHDCVFLPEKLHRTLANGTIRALALRPSAIDTRNPLWGGCAHGHRKHGTKTRDPASF